MGIRNTLRTGSLIAALVAGICVPVSDAFAVFAHVYVQQSHVVSAVTTGSGNWTYGYTLYNDSYEDASGTVSALPVIVDWELPWFADAGITNIVSPTGWTYAIETVGAVNAATGWDGIAAWQDLADPMYQGAASPFTSVSQVLHWYSTCWVDSSASGCAGNELANAIYPVLTPSEGQTSLSGFGFTAGYADTGAPYESSWAYLTHWTGDPALPLGVPASPDTLGSSSVPEPGMIALFGIGLSLLGWSRRRR